MALFSLKADLVPHPASEFDGNPVPTIHQDENLASQEK
jgi:hypothetical protein